MATNSTGLKSQTTAAELWEIGLAPGSNAYHLGKHQFLSAAGMKPRLEKTKTGARLVYDRLHNGKQEWDICLTIDITAVDDEFRIAGTVVNNEKNWTVCWIKLPILKNLHSEQDNGALTAYWPKGLGEKLILPKQCHTRSSTYPSPGMTMQWIALAGSDAGLYLGCHDPKDSKKTFSLVNHDQNSEFSLMHEIYCLPGKTTEVPATVVMPFSGTWHKAAKRYRKWIDTWMPIASKPKWLQNASGWLLCILKQQNGDIMYPYNMLEKAADIADERGLDVIALFGWAHGGHDRDYPEYRPDPLMGGREGVIEGIKRLHARGKRVIIYSNGVFIDAASEFYTKQGYKAICAKPNAQPYVWFFDKFRSSSVPVFLQACPGSSEWYERLLALGKQAQELGADGILFDSVAAIGNDGCYTQNHAHANPAQAYAECRMNMVHRLAEELRRDNPEFICMTEAILGTFMRDLSFFHGLGHGFNYAEPGPNQMVFPEMFRYTFPEVACTQRESCPMLTRNQVNFACMYGMRHEMESRYPADVKYLLEGIVPSASDYSDCNSPPPVSLMKTIPPKEAAGYLRATIDMERRNAELLWNGSFVDNEGFEIEGEGVAAKSFRTGDTLGVVVWNYTKQPQSLKLQVPGFEFQSVDEPGAKTPPAAESPIPPESIRFFKWIVSKKS